MSESYLLYHTQCPECAKMGNDTRGNNLGVYSDGHSHCFACKFTIIGDKVKAYKANNIERRKDLPKEVQLPLDVTPDLPPIAVKWLEKYEFNMNTNINNRILWSEYQQKLIFPYFIDGVLVGWQGRCFDPEEAKKRKWFSQGKLDSFIYTRGKQCDTIVLTESIISAIKVARYNYSSAIYGSVISTLRWVALSHLADTVILWLGSRRIRYYHGWPVAIVLL